MRHNWAQSRAPSGKTRSSPASDKIRSRGSSPDRWRNPRVFRSDWRHFPGPVQASDGTARPWPAARRETADRTDDDVLRTRRRLESHEIRTSGDIAQLAHRYHGAVANLLVDHPFPPIRNGDANRRSDNGLALSAQLHAGRTYRLPVSGRTGRIGQRIQRKPGTALRLATRT